MQLKNFIIPTVLSTAAVNAETSSDITTTYTSTIIVYTTRLASDTSASSSSDLAASKSIASMKSVSSQSVESVLSASSASASSISMVEKLKAESSSRVSVSSASLASVLSASSASILSASKASVSSVSAASVSSASSASAASAASESSVLYSQINFNTTHTLSSAAGLLAIASSNITSNSSTLYNPIPRTYAMSSVSFTSLEDVARSSTGVSSTAASSTSASLTRNRDDAMNLGINGVLMGAAGGIILGLL